VLTAGLAARTVSQRARAKKPHAARMAPSRPAVKSKRRKAMPTRRYLIATKEANPKLVKFAIEEAKARDAFLFVLQVKEIRVGALPERISMPSNGIEAKIDEWCNEADIDYQLLQIPSWEVGYTIAEQAATYGVERVMIGSERRNRLENVLKGSVMGSLNKLLPEEVQLVIFGGG